jgi:large subunit ribosomal protein L22
VKQKKTQEKQENKVYAKAKYLRISPDKLRRIAKIIRTKPVQQAVAILKALPHKGAGILLKVINSAAANATNNHKMKADELYVAELLVNEGPQMKRYQARARGRIYQILKRSSHITVGLDVSKGGR